VTERYRFAYGYHTVYRHVVELILAHVPDGGEVVVDLGCGYGAIAEPLRAEGLDYVGIDVDADAADDLRRRGFDAGHADLNDPEEAIGLARKLIGDRQLAAIVMLDTLEHITNAVDVLRACRSLAVEYGPAYLVVAVPNVTHIDIGTKLLMGRWDVTETGILDDTHVAFYSENRLHSVLGEAGWRQVDALDFELPFSDQHFPSDAAALAVGAPLQVLLQSVREQSAPHAVVNEFVRLYVPSAVSRDVRPTEADRPFLSVLMRTQGRRLETLQDALLSLAAQTCDDFEVLLLAHRVQREVIGHIQYLVDAHGPDFASRVRLITVDTGGRSRPLNVGVERAQGSYVAVLDDDDVVFAHWVETFKELAARSPGRVLRTVPAAQTVRPAEWQGGRRGYEIAGRPRCPWPTRFEVIAHLFENLSPPCCYALPRSAFRDMGVRFDETLPVLEDWDVLMRVGLWSGVESVEKVTSLYRWWEGGGDSSVAVHTDFEWTRARSAVVSKLDSTALVLPPRSLTALHDLIERADRAERTKAELLDSLDQMRRAVSAYEEAASDATQQLAAMRASTSWKVSAPLRLVGRAARRIVHRRAVDG